jgi:hypothetical protein
VPAEAVPGQVELTGLQLEAAQRVERLGGEPLMTERFGQLVAAAAESCGLVRFARVVMEDGAMAERGGEHRPVSLSLGNDRGGLISLRGIIEESAELPVLGQAKQLGVGAATQLHEKRGANTQTGRRWGIIQWTRGKPPYQRAGSWGTTTTTRLARC